MPGLTFYFGVDGGITTGQTHDDDGNLIDVHPPDMLAGWVEGEYETSEPIMRDGRAMVDITVTGMVEVQPLEWLGDWLRGVEACQE